MFKSKQKKEIINDSYESLDGIYEAFNTSGIDTISLIYAVDVTGSNIRNGRKSFEGLPLHTIRENRLNYYEQTISLLGQTLEQYDSDKSIPTYYFGCSETKDTFLGELSSHNNGYADVLLAYRNIIPRVTMDGPTSFKPIIDHAIAIVRETKRYHLLVIMCDGEISKDCKKATDKALIEASKYPLSIVIIGIGDGPWDGMNHLDDNVKHKKFDNVQFVCANDYLRATTEHRDIEDPLSVKARHDSFLVEVLQEIPQQYTRIGDLKLIKNCSKPTKYKYHTNVISHPEWTIHNSNNNDNGNNNCPICWERPKNGCIQPCGHLICFGNECHRGIQESSQCPICRAHVSGITRIYN